MDDHISWIKRCIPLSQAWSESFELISTLRSGQKATETHNPGGVERSVAPLWALKPFTVLKFESCLFSALYSVILQLVEVYVHACVCWWLAVPSLSQSVCVLMIGYAILISKCVCVGGVWLCQPDLFSLSHSNHAHMRSNDYSPLAWTPQVYFMHVIEVFNTVCIITHHVALVHDPNEGRMLQRYSSSEGGLSAQCLPLERSICPLFQLKLLLISLFSLYLEYFAKLKTFEFSFVQCSLPHFAHELALNSCLCDYVILSSGLNDVFEQAIVIRTCFHQVRIIRSIISMSEQRRAWALNPLSLSAQALGRGIKLVWSCVGLWCCFWLFCWYSVYSGLDAYCLMSLVVDVCISPSSM